jgi:hypothetical protein
LAQFCSAAAVVLLIDGHNFWAGALPPIKVVQLNGAGILQTTYQQWFEV